MHSKFIVSRENGQMPMTLKNTHFLNDFENRLKMFRIFESPPPQVCVWVGGTQDPEKTRGPTASS